MHIHSLLTSTSLGLCFSAAAAAAAASTLEPLADSAWISDDSASVTLEQRQVGRSLNGHHQWKRAMGPAWKVRPTLKTSKVSTGVAAMQLTVVDTETVLIIDKAENNPLSVKGQYNGANGKAHPAWMQWLNVYSGKGKALDAQTNSFCAGGSWLSNGTMFSAGGNPRVNAASYYNANGLTGVRMFENCNNKGCTLVEHPSRVRLSSARWYPGTTRLADGSVMLMGGMTEGGFNNVKETDNPTFEFFPVKAFANNQGLPVYSKFLADSLNSNLFPIAFTLPGGLIFVAANTRAMLYNWEKQTETRLANIPNGVRVTYPASAASALLPLTIANKWTASVLFCGGSTFDDTKAVYGMSSQMAASKQCVRMDLTSAGMKKGWVREADLPEARTMGETVLTPDGKVLILNGGKTGIAGYANVHDPVGQSNADNPTYRGLVYNPLLSSGKRLSTLMPTSKIPRLYHSVATLMPSGEVLITGSNPNADVSKAAYKTDYSIEILSPPYMSASRPRMDPTWFPEKITFGKSFKIKIYDVASNLAEASISIVLMDLGYHTHAVAVDQRLVELNHSGWCSVSAAKSKGCGKSEILVKSPKDGTYFPPGYGWLFAVVNGIPSAGLKVMVGSGASPPSSVAATNYMLQQTSKTYGKAIWAGQ